MLCERLGERQDDYTDDEVEYHVRDEDETETESCVSKIDKNAWWRKRLKQAMCEYGYEKYFAENLVDQLQTETDGTIVSNQLEEVTACGKNSTT